MSNDTVVLIPARGGSKRVPRKNICDLNGFPLISYTINLALRLDIPTYVSTEDKEIADISRFYGANVIDRPKEYADDSSLDVAWIRHALYILREKENWKPTKIIFLRPTTPLRSLKTVKTAIKLFTDYYTSMRSVEELPEAIEKTLRLRNGFLKSPFEDEEVSLLPNQSFEPSYKANGYIDIVRSQYVMLHGDLYGKRCRGIITPRTVEIDTMEDLEYAKYLLEKHIYI